MKGMGIEANGLANSPQSALNRLMKTQPEGGRITIDQFAQETGLDPVKAREFLKTASGGTFVRGRRGHKSRFVYGTEFDKFRHQEEIRFAWRKKQGLPLNAFPIAANSRTIHKETAVNVDRTGINENATEQILEILKALPQREALRTADYVHRLVEHAMERRPEMMKRYQEAKAKRAK